MYKKTSIALIVIIIFLIPFYFSSCCGDESCSEEDTYGKAIFKKTDTVYQRVAKLERGPMSIQIGAFVNKENAEYYLREAKNKLNTEVVIKYTPEGVFRILIGEYKDIESAREMLRHAKTSGYDDAFIRDEFGVVER